MVWFKVDDKLHDHPKVREAGISAMGLWVVAGSWSADNLTDGFVPESVIRRWDHNWKRSADRLVKVGLWTAETRVRAGGDVGESRVRAGGDVGETWLRGGGDVAERFKGEPGYRFHQWQERQPTRSDIEKGREADRLRMAETRAAKRPRSENVRSTRPDPYPTRPVVPSEQPREDVPVPAESTATKRVKNAAAAFHAVSDQRDLAAENGHQKELDQ